MERLQKVLAQAGIASRRAAEQIILAGRVRVDGKIVRELGTQVDPRKNRVEVDGNTIVAEKLIYLVLHKPRGVVCTLSDPEGRPTIRDLLKDAGARVVPVGRLDFHTSGALLCTNDGEFAQALAHPKLEVPKVYVAKVMGAVDDDALERFSDQVVIDGRPTRPAQVKRLRFEGDKTWLEITLREGRNRQVRRLGEATGFPVMRLARISHAGVTSEDLRPGQWRPLSVDELVDIKKSYGVPKKVRPPEFVAAEKVSKGQRRPARPDIRGKIHDRSPKPPRPGARPPRDDASGSRDEARAFHGEPRQGRAAAREIRSDERGQSRKAPFQGDHAPSKFANRKLPFQSDASQRGFSSGKAPFSAERGPSKFSGGRAPFQGERGPSKFSAGKAPFSAERGPSKFSGGKAPFQGERGPSKFSGGKAAFQTERGQSPRHDDVDLPWKERSRSAIERRVSTNKGRPSADRGSGQQGRGAGNAKRGSEQNARGKPGNAAKPTARRDAPKSAHRRGTSR